MVDVLRFALMLALGASVALEISVLRYTAAVAHFPSGVTIMVRRSALVARGCARLGGTIFMAISPHDRIGQPISWQLPLAALVASFSLYGSIRTLAEKEQRYEPNGA